MLRKYFPMMVTNRMIFWELNDNGHKGLPSPTIINWRPFDPI